MNTLTHLTEGTEVPAERFAAALDAAKASAAAVCIPVCIGVGFFSGPEEGFG